MLNYNTHTIAIQVPKTDLLKAPFADGTIGIYASASRPKIRILRGDGTIDANGPLVQVSRLGNPLINEVVIPLGKKDYWNASDPRKDKPVRRIGTRIPSSRASINALYPVLGTTSLPSRRAAAAISSPCCSPGVPTLNFTGDTKADLLRLNTQFTAPPVGTGNRLGLLGGRLLRLPERTPARRRRDGHRDPRHRVRIRARRRPDHRELRVLQRQREPLSEQHRR